MFYKISDFQKEWAVESEATLKLLRVLTDKSLGQEVSENGRTLGRIAWHIVCGVGKTLSQAGLPSDMASDETELPASADKILKEYEKSAKEAINLISNKWTDETLQDEVQVFGDKWKRGYVLMVLIKHQIHHRAQMTILMRQAGLKVPGVYGPSREEWQSMNMPPRP